MILKLGEIIKTIPIKGENQIATIELSVLNNTGNDCSDVVLLGRIPFKGNKDIATGDNLGTTSDTKLVGALVSDERIKDQFTIYYSENGEATKDLTDNSNGWTPTPESFDNIKSYLINTIYII